MVVAGISNLMFKFDVTLDILEEDNKGFSSAARDKNCFKLRQDLCKKVSITVQQLTNKHLIVERFAITLRIINVALNHKGYRPLPNIGDYSKVPLNILKHFFLF